MADLEFTGGLDLSDAVASVDAFAADASATIDAALTSVSASFGAAFATAGTDAVATIAADITGSLSEIPITANVDAASATISDLVASVDAETPTVSVEADVAVAQSDVSDLVASVDGETTAITVEGNTDPAGGAVADLVSGIDAETPTINVEADTSDAQGAVDDLTASIDDAGASASSSGAQLSGFGDTSGQVGALAELAAGQVGGLGEASSIFGEHAKAAAAGGLALAAGVGELYHIGLQALSAEQNYNATLGETATRVEAIHVGDLNTGLFELTAKMGATDASTRGAASSIFQFAINAGTSREGAAQFTDELFALAARAVALKPSLGDVTSVAESMTSGLGRAKSVSTEFGISLSQAQINARALADTGKASVSDLSAYEKSVAGAELAVEKYGTTLKQTVEVGSKNAAIEEQRLKSSFEDFVASVGKPLVAPGLDAIAAAIPDAKQLGTALADIASVAIPILTAGLDLIGPAILPVVAGFAAFKLANAAISFVGWLQEIPAAISGLTLLGTTAETTGAEMAAGEAAGTAGLSLIFAGLAAGAVALGLFGGSTDATAQKVKDFATALENANGKLDDTAAKAARSLFEERNQMDDLVTAGLKLPAVLDSTSKSSASERDALKQLLDVMHDLHVSNGSTATSTELYGKSVEELKGQQLQLVGQIRLTNPALAAQLDVILKTQPANTGLVKTLRDLAVAHADVNTKLKERQQTGAADNELTKQSTTLIDISSKSFAHARAEFGDFITEIAAGSGVATTDLDSLAKHTASLDKATASSFDSATSLVSNFAGAWGVSTDAILADLQKQVTAAQRWSDDLIALGKAGIDQGLLEQLRAAGPKAEPLVAGLLQAVNTGNLGVINMAEGALRTLLTQTNQTLDDLEVQALIKQAHEATVMDAIQKDMVAGGTANLDKLRTSSDSILSDMATKAEADMGRVGKTIVDNTTSSATVAGGRLAELQGAIDALHGPPPIPITADDSQLLATLAQASAAIGQFQAEATTALAIAAQSLNPDGTPKKLAEGGIIRARPGGTLVTVAEAGHDEVVVPTDNMARATDLLSQAGILSKLQQPVYAPAAVQTGGGGPVTITLGPVYVSGVGSGDMKKAGEDFGNGAAIALRKARVMADARAQ